MQRFDPIPSLGTLDTLVYYHDFPSDSIKVYYSYDMFKRVSKISYSDNTFENFTYDKRGNLLKKIVSTMEVEEIYKIEYGYDARNRLVMVREYPDLSGFPPTCDTTIYVYNLHDAMIKFSNANDNPLLNTTIEYDLVADRLYRTRYPDNNEDSLGYYASGYLQFKKDRRGKVIDYSYDDRWRLLKKRFYDSWSDYTSSNPADSVVFWLDKGSRIDSLLDNNGKLLYSYDGLDRMYQLDTYSSKMVKYVFDRVSSRTNMKVCKSSDTTVVYLEQKYPSYDEANRLLKTVVSLDTFDITYWDTGPIKQIDYPNDLKEQYWLSGRNNIDSMRTYYSEMQPTLFENRYTYNFLGDRDSAWFKISRPSLMIPLYGAFGYTYDDVRRLIFSQEHTYGTDDIRYTYDGVGNRMKKIVGTDTTSYTYNKQNNRMTYAGAIQYVYDNNGNVTEIHPVQEVDYYYTWDYENRLTKVKKSGSGGPDSLRFTYCALGNRIQKLHSTSDTTKYTFDGMYVVCRFGNNDSLLSKYVYANGVLLARVDSSDARYYYHHDGLGSTMGITDTLRAISKSYLYDDFGDLWDSWGSVSNTYQYTGQEYDDEIQGTELYNLRARYYDPETDRFLSEDPELAAKQDALINIHYKYCEQSSRYYDMLKYNPQVLNRYLYVFNNPLNFSDITGRYPRWLCLPIAILKAWGSTGGNKANEAMKHCVYSCEIARECSPLTSAAAGIFKEIIDYIGSKTGKWPGTPSTADLGKDAAGIGCSFNHDPCNPDKYMDCLKCCEEIYGK
jgi:RHS repeat-associated protein